MNFGFMDNDDDDFFNDGFGNMGAGFGNIGRGFGNFDS